MTNYSNLIPTPGAASLLGLTPRSLDVARAKGDIALDPATTIGRQNYYRVSDVRKVLQSRAPRIYLAGKIAQNDWRHSVVPDLRNQFGSGECVQTVSGIAPTRNTGDWEFGPDPIKCPGFVYTGPFFVADDHGCAHGPTSHGAVGVMWDEVVEGRPIDLKPQRAAAHRNALRGIRQATAVFAWLGGDDALTAYGTFSEIGYAAALGTPVYIGTDRPLDPELWFVTMHACQVITAPDPVSAFEQALTALTN